jgi:hypothetical protein
VSSAAGAAHIVPSPRARYQVGIALDQDRVAILAESDCFAVAQAQQVVIARLLRDGPWRAVVSIVRLADGAVLDRLPVASGRAA